MKHIPHNPPPPSSPPHLTFENTKLNLPLHIQTSHSLPINSTSLQTTKPHIHSLKTQPSSPPPNLTFIPSKLNLPPHHQTSHSFPQNSISLSTSKPHIHSLKLNFPPHHQILSNSLPITNPYIHPVITQTPPPPPSNNAPLTAILYMQPFTTQYIIFIPKQNLETYLLTLLILHRVLKKGNPGQLIHVTVHISFLDVVSVAIPYSIQLIRS